jgi:acyl carrier protein
MKLKEIQNIIRKEVEQTAGAKLRSLDQDIFFKSGFMDSINMLGIIVFLEKRFRIKIDTFFRDRKSVSSVNKLAKKIKSKLDRKGR